MQASTTSPATSPTLATATSPLPSVEPEQQSPLTEKFTTTEWEAIKELRTALPLIFEEAFNELKPGKALETVDIWGVKLDPSKGGIDDARISAILLKFLRARNMNVEQATQMLIATLKWRHEFKASETVNETFPEDVFGKAGFIFGKDKGGRPITYNVYGNQDLGAVFGDTQRFLRWRVGLMEKGLRLVDFTTVDSLVQVHDYDGVGMGSRTADSKRAASEATKIFQDYYPELLFKKYFINVPLLMTWIFWAFKPLVSAQTFAKLQVVGKGSEVIGKEMLQVIDKKELPKQYGGEAEGP